MKASCGRWKVKEADIRMLDTPRLVREAAEAAETDDDLLGNSMEALIGEDDMLKALGRAIADGR